MSDIITTSEVQKKIGEISATIHQKSFIVTNHGKGKIVMLPYYDGCDVGIEEYMEDYEMTQNKAMLIARYRDASKEDNGDLTV